MSLSIFIRNAIPNDVERVYTRLVYPEEMKMYMRRRTTDAATENDVSLKPFLDRKAIFFHIPKCAGISVAKELFGCRAGGHMTLHSYRNAFTGKEFRRFFKFTFVRNPWDRLVSAYFFLKAGGMDFRDERSADASVRRYPDFTTFVEQYMATEDFNERIHFRPQWSFVCASPRHPPQVDFVGRYERMEEDFAKIAKRLNHAGSLPHRNAGPSRPRDYRELYNDRTAEIVAKAYARDIKLFGYNF